MGWFVGKFVKSGAYGGNGKIEERERTVMGFWNIVFFFSIFFI